MSDNHTVRKKIIIYDAKKERDEEVEKIVKTDDEWRSLLDKKSFYVIREKGTEPVFSGEYNSHKHEGLYQCAGCGNHLFDSKAKFDSGTGWPSYYAPVDMRNIQLVSDRSLFMERVEVVCSRCGAHLGHVFDDGPQPTGKRYCINSVSLKFNAES